MDSLEVGALVTLFVFLALFLHWATEPKKPNVTTTRQREETTKRESPRFWELIVASVSGVVASKVYDIIYSTPIKDMSDSISRAILYVFMVLGLIGFLYIMSFRMPSIRILRRKRPQKTLDNYC